MTSPIRLLIVDDHALFRESVGRLLAQEADFSISSVCGTLAEAESVLGQTAVDVVLLDYDLGNALGTELIATIHHQFSHVKVLMLTGGVSAAVVRSSLQAGIAGVLLKHCSPEQLLEAIRQVASGGTWWDPAAMAAPTPSASVTSEISKQQACILRLLLEGLSNKEVSGHMNISESAVKASIQELFRKTGVRTRSQLVRIALESDMRGKPMVASTAQTER